MRRGRLPWGRILALASSLTFLASFIRHLLESQRNGRGNTTFAAVDTTMLVVTTLFLLLVGSVVLTFTLTPLAAIVAIFALFLEYRFVRGLVADVRARRDSRARRVR